MWNANWMLEVRIDTICIISNLNSDRDRDRKIDREEYQNNGGHLPEPLAVSECMWW